MRFARASRGRVVGVLDADPELAEPLDTTELPAVHRAAVARVVEAARGPFLVRLPALPPGSFGFLVLAGVQAADLRLGHRPTVELVGPGDLIRPGKGVTRGPELLIGVEFRALLPTRLAVLDRAFAERVAPWPEVAAGVVGRSVLRARRLQLQAGVRGLPRVDERISTMLWHYAERWGRMTRDGAVLDLPLTHGQLADIVGANRQTVTTQLGLLRARGEIVREGPARWRLLGSPPEALTQLDDELV